MQNHVTPTVTPTTVRLRKRNLGAAAKWLGRAGLLVLASAPASLLAQDALSIDEQGNIRIGRGPSLVVVDDGSISASMRGANNHTSKTFET